MCQEERPIWLSDGVMCRVGPSLAGPIDVPDWLHDECIPSWIAGNRIPSGPPDKLDKFTEAIGRYGVSELNDALVTTFGEISPRVSSNLAKEARAVASTIFNRLSRIEKARDAYGEAKSERDAAAQDQAISRNNFEELANHPSKYRKDRGDEQYKNDVMGAKRVFHEANGKFAAAQRKLNNASSEKNAAEAYVAPSRRRATLLTLSDIVAQKEQYAGFPKGTQDFANYPNMSLPDKTRNADRWQTAKTAVEALAGDPSQRDGYEQFRANGNGRQKIVKGRTRVGGNDFW
jgi:hypothetical protein